MDAQHPTANGSVPAPERKKDPSILCPNCLAKWQDNGYDPRLMEYVRLAWKILGGFVIDFIIYLWRSPNERATARIQAYLPLMKEALAEGDSRKFYQELQHLYPLLSKDQHWIKMQPTIRMPAVEMVEPEGSQPVDISQHITSDGGVAFPFPIRIVDWKVDEERWLDFHKRCLEQLTRTLRYHETLDVQNWNETIMANDQIRRRFLRRYCEGANTGAVYHKL